MGLARYKAFALFELDPLYASGEGEVFIVNLVLSEFLLGH